MIFWHVGTTLVILWFTFRGNPRLDYRVAAVGALLPDLVDKPLGRIAFGQQFGSGRLYGHTLVLNVAFFAILFFLRGRKKRRIVLLPIGSLLHLAEDSVWSTPRVFWWPFFGTTFPRSTWPGFEQAVRGALPQELIGLVLLLWLFAAHGALSRKGMIRFLRTGRLEQVEA